MRQMLAVAVQSGTTLVAGRAKVLFELPGVQAQTHLVAESTTSPAMGGL